MKLIDYIRAASDTGCFESLDFDLDEGDDSDYLWYATGLKDGESVKYYGNTPEESLVELVNDLK